MTSELVLVRHGQTEWSRDGRHTGRTDVPLTSDGELQAALLRPVLAARRPALVLVSPLIRARRTAELAGLDDPSNAHDIEVDGDLQEWDYGGYEGLTTPEIRELTGTEWTVFDDGVIPGDGPGSTPGETLQQVAERAQRVLERVHPALERGDVVLVGHGHALRVLAACWLDADPTFGARLLLEPATTCVLGEQHDVRAVSAWNVPAQAGGQPPASTP